MVGMDMDMNRDMDMDMATDMDDMDMKMDMNIDMDMDMNMEQMTFTISFPGVIVISGWSVTTALDLVLSLAGLLILTIFFESITRITKHASIRTLCYMAKRNLHHTTNTIRKGLYEQLTIPEGLKRTLSIQLSSNRWDVLSVPTSEVENVSVSLRWSQRFRYRLLVACLHMGQMMVAYFIMLAVMTMNLYIFLIVIAGSSIGYFLFGGMVKPDEHNKTLVFRRQRGTVADDETVGEQTPIDLTEENLEKEVGKESVKEEKRFINETNDNNSSNSLCETNSVGETIV